MSLTFLMFALLAGQAVAVMAMLVLPSVAPAIARDYGIDPSLIGYQIALASLGQLSTLMFLGNLSRKLGACRACQIGHTCIAAGLLLMALPSKALLVLGSIVMGMGHGMITPSSTSLLIRFAPAKRRNFLFSLQQTGVPVGGIMAALIAPAIAVTAGWRWALVATALMLLAIVVMMQRGRPAWDTDRDPATRAVSSSPSEGFLTVWRDRRLRLIALAGGAFCWTQFIAMTYTVVVAVVDLEMSLVVAGTLLMAVQLGSMIGRVGAGWTADRVGPRRVLAWIGWLQLAMAAVMIWMAPSWPAILLYALFTFFGAVSGAWAGLMLAELGRLAPRGHVAASMSGAMIYINAGKFLGPVVFANVYALTHDYAISFASLAVPALFALYCLSQVPARRAAPTEERSAV